MFRFLGCEREQPPARLAPSVHFPSCITSISLEARGRQGPPPRPDLRGFSCRSVRHVNRISHYLKLLAFPYRCCRTRRSFHHRVDFTFGRRSKLSFLGTCRSTTRIQQLFRPHLTLGLLPQLTREVFEFLRRRLCVHNIVNNG